MSFERELTQNNVLKSISFSALALILALLPVGAFAMGKPPTPTPTPTATPTPPPSAADHDVIIVGAGAAGLYAAYELDNMGFDVLVLEARSRHGGRVHAVPFGGQMVEEHAEGMYNKNWHYDDIHALDKNRLTEIYPDDKNHTTAYNFDGDRVTGYDADKKNYPELYDYWDFYYNADAYTGPDVDAETGVCNYKGICPGSIYWHLYDAGYPGGENATSPHAIGMRSLAIQEGLWDIGIGEMGFTNATWIDTLDELYFNSILGKVQLNSTVTAVDTSVSPAEVTYQNTGGGGSSSLTAHAVLVTVPTGVLEAGDISFTPPLSAAKLDALTKLEPGNGAKFFLEFDHTVWPSNWVGIHTPGLAGYCWANTWYKVGSPNNILACFTMGDNAAALKAMSAQDQVTAVLAALDDMTAFPNQSATQFTDAFVAAQVEWSEDEEFNKGVYSAPGVGSYPTDGSPSARQVLAEPVGTSLYFAGEATNHETPETVFGALDSGLRAAGEIDADHTPQ